MFFALPLRFPEAQHVIITLSFFKPLNFLLSSCNGMFLAPFICPLLNSPGERTSKMMAPFFFNSAKSTFGPPPNNLLKNPIFIVVAPFCNLLPSSPRRFHIRCHGTLKIRSEEHTSELQSRPHLVCRLLLEKK